jgi:hypothetical protein
MKVQGRFAHNSGVKDKPAEVKAIFPLTKDATLKIIGGNLIKRRESLMEEKNGQEGFQIHSTTRRVIALSASLYINIPKGFIEKHNLKAGDTLTLVWDNSLRIVVPNVS